MQKVAFSRLPEAYGEMHAIVPTDIHELHLLALTRPNKVDNIKVLEVTADVVCKIDAMGRVAASCSPVSGVGLKGPHSSQTQAVHIPDKGILVHRSVYLEGSTPEGRQGTIFISPGHHQGPCKTRLGLEVTVCWETVAGRVVEAVHSTGGCALQQIIKAGGGTKFLVVLKEILWFRTRISLKVSRIKLSWSAVMVKNKNKTNKKKTNGTGGSG